MKVVWGQSAEREAVKFICGQSSEGEAVKFMWSQSSKRELELEKSHGKVEMFFFALPIIFYKS